LLLKVAETIGWKVTWMVQLAPPARTPGQVFPVSVKAAEPVSEIPWIPVGKPDVFVTVTERDGLSPTCMAPKFTLAGFTKSAGEVPPSVPVPDTSRLKEGRLVMGMETEAETGPTAVGANWMRKTQLAPAFKVAPQLVLSLKPAGITAAVNETVDPELLVSVDV
jgi:hypothetical protein